MHEFMPSPDMIRSSFHLFWRLASLKLINEVPIKMKQANRTNKPPLGFSKALWDGFVSSKEKRKF
jgi:hypothetical protein